MKSITSNIYEWLSHASFRNIYRCTQGADSAVAEIGLYGSIYLPKHNWFEEQIYETASNHSALTRSTISGSLLIESDSLIADWYDFGSDDKYFLVNGHEVGYQDSLLYSDFYKTLPDLQRTEPFRLNIQPGSLAILSRSQFGHYLLDDLIPSLSIAKDFFQEAGHVTLLCRHKWQETAGRFFAKTILPGSEVTAIYLEKGSRRYAINNCYFTIPAFPDISFYSRDLLRSCYAGSVNTTLAHQASTNPIRLYLSREGFESEARVRNRDQVISHLRDIKCEVNIVRPHAITLDALVSASHAHSQIICEPGTTPLIAYLSSAPGTQFLNLMSSRCISECSPKYFYSGWRYHLPYLSSAIFAWGRAIAAKDNPFSDILCYNPNFIRP